MSLLSFDIYNSIGFVQGAIVAFIPDYSHAK